MWVYLNDAFLSIVVNNDDPHFLLVRSRKAGDIENVFPEAEVEKTPGNDYAFRASIARVSVAVALSKEVHRIDYSNFKNSVKEKDRSLTYSRVWSDTVDGFGTGMYSRSLPRGKYRMDESYLDDLFNETAIEEEEYARSNKRYFDDETGRKGREIAEGDNSAR